MHHDVAGLDIPMNQLPLVHRAQTGGDLRRDFKYQLELQPAGAFDKIFECLPLYKLHRVEVVLTGSAQAEHRGDIRVTNAGRSPRFAQKTKASRFVTEILLADGFQG